VEDWAEIRRLYRSENLSQAAIARRLGLSSGLLLMRRHHVVAYPGGLGLSTQKSNPSSEPATQS
jgi:hypothetical protein